MEQYHNGVRISHNLLLALVFLISCARAQTITIVNATVIDVTNGRTAPGTTVTIHGNRIASVAPGNKAGRQAGQIVDATGEYLIPGLWDMHTHVYFDNTSADGTDLILPLFLAYGVTGIRDMGSDLDLILRARKKSPHTGCSARA